MAAIYFGIAFSWMKMIEFRSKFYWNIFPWVQLTISQHWFRYWLGAGQATSHYLDQWWLISLTHICGTRGRWVKWSTQHVTVYYLLVLWNGRGSVCLEWLVCGFVEILHGSESCLRHFIVKKTAMLVFAASCYILWIKKLATSMSVLLLHY